MRKVMTRQPIPSMSLIRHKQQQNMETTKLALNIMRTWLLNMRITGVNMPKMRMISKGQMHQIRNWQRIIGRQSALKEETASAPSGKK